MALFQDFGQAMNMHRSIDCVACSSRTLSAECAGTVINVPVVVDLMIDLCMALWREAKCVFYAGILLSGEPRWLRGHYGVLFYCYCVSLHEFVAWYSRDALVPGAFSVMNLGSK